MFAPYAYQTECLEVINAKRAEGRRRLLIVMASGLGKTVTIAFDARSWLEQFGGRVLYLCHQNEILYQAKATFEVVLGNSRTYGFFHGLEKTAHQVDCLFASFATMVKNIKLFQPDEFDYVVVDESHHSHAETFKPVVDYFTPRFLLGATATPNRLDERNIRDIYGEEVYSLPLVEALARDLLTPVDYRLLSDEIQANTLLQTPNGRFSIKQLNRTIFVPKRDEEIIEIVKRNAAQINNPRIIYFCSSIRHCDYLAKLVPDCLTLHSLIPAKERGVRLELFRQGLISTAITRDCFNEGVDVPEANVIVFLRTTASTTVFMQQLGRGLRRSKDKDKVIVLDFVANCERIRLVHDLWQEVRDTEQQLGVRGRHHVRELVPPMTLNVEGVAFNETIVQLIDIFNRIEANCYPTWQEAGLVARTLGFQTRKDYLRGYKKDSRLSSRPDAHYADWPGWYEFLGKSQKEFYKTWQEAAAAAKKIGICVKIQYRKEYTKDSLLPSCPTDFYPDFPGWARFFDRFYATWQEASEAAARVGLTTMRLYRSEFKKDPKLPSSPHRAYEDFPGWKIFLRKEVLLAS